MANETVSPRTGTSTTTRTTITAANDNRPARATYGADSEDAVLIVGLLDRDSSAWREFKRRFDPLLRHQVRKTIGWAMREVLPSDAIEDVLGDFYLSILDNEMKRLRDWADGPRETKLPSWLRMRVTQVAVDHVRAAFRRLSMRDDLESDRDFGVSDENWGDAWLDVQDVIAEREQKAAREAASESDRQAKKVARQKRVRAKQARARRAKAKKTK